MFSASEEVADQTFPDSTYLAVMTDFSALGVPVSYQTNPALFFELHKWLGTPHRRRGQQGIDCSGLVKIIYRKVYGIDLKGSSQDMSRLIVPLPQESLKEGDLVFFRVYHQSRIDHVGIYLGGGKFIHTSSSQGVKISDLSETYFKRNLVKGGRLPDFSPIQTSVAKDQ
jgi:cell wall-associated NlpC family hydrolase